MDESKNLRYDFLIEAAQFNVVIRRMKQHKYLFAKVYDKVEEMMFAWAIKKLEQTRDSLLTQGLNSLSPGYDVNQVNPSKLLEEIK